MPPGELSSQKVRELVYVSHQRKLTVRPDAKWDPPQREQFTADGGWQASLFSVFIRQELRFFDVLMLVMDEISAVRKILYHHLMVAAFWA